jgi:hypothetical protein
MSNDMVRAGLHFLSQELRALSIEQQTLLNQLSDAFQQYGSLTRDQQKQLLTLLEFIGSGG